jgi:hypothetical protein
MKKTYKYIRLWMFGRSASEASDPSADLVIGKDIDRLIEILSVLAEG